MMKKTLFMRYFPVAVLVVFLFQSAEAQFGISANYLSTNEQWEFSAFDGFNAPENLVENGWSAGIDYWFRLKNKRIEFLPELNYASFTNDYTMDLRSQSDVYSFFFNTNFYLWDFNGDCDCPTFSKQGPTLEKGLFVQLSPGVSYWKLAYGNKDAPFLEDESAAFSIGAGAGFDIGITDLITLTPIVRLRYYPSVDSESPISYLDENEVLTDGTARIAGSPLFWSGGIRLGFRLDSDRY